jgi:GNAT superfamily N-acetyltransferase
MGPVTAKIEEYSIRLALPGEAGAVAAVERRAIRVFESHLIETGLTLEALARVDSADALDQAQREGRLWVAQSARGELVGFALVCPMGGTANLEELDVLPEHARRGVGSRLLETVCAWAREVGYARVTLSTFRDIAWNAPFYERRGFRVVDPSTLSRAHVDSVSAEKARGGRTDLRVVMEFKT